MYNNADALIVKTVRNPYDWGRSRRIMNLKPGESLTVIQTKESDFPAYRSLASRLGKIYGVRYSVNIQPDRTIKITRTL